MSLITRCPACETLFKVVPDQLRISEGWVRCGQCDEIFDASYHLLPDPLAEVHADAPDAALAELPPLELDFDLGLDAQLDDVPEAWSQANHPVIEAQEPLATVPLAPEQTFLPEPAFESALAMQALNDIPALAPHPVVDMADKDAVAVADVPDTTLDGIAFLNGKKSDLAAPSHWHRVIGWVLGGLLLFGLWVQVMVHERDRIVARAPGLTPVLQALCKPLQCTLSPLRQLDAIVVESASFIKLNGDTYRLNFTVKNTAATTLAVPVIELTLTNLGDQAVVRRVFLAAEMGIDLSAMAPGSEWSASLPLEVKLAEAGDAVAGYRVLAFYP